MAWNDEWRFRDCPWCGVKDVAMGHRGQWQVQSARGERFFSAVGCPRCGGSVVIEYAHSNHTHPDPIAVFPENQQSIGVEHLPPDVKAYYTDAKRVLDAGVPDAAAVQMRRTLEAATAHFEQTDRVLFKRIQGLIDRGLITQSFGDVLHHVRAVGNIGAHATDERVDEATARRVFSFTTPVLRNLFEVPAELRKAMGEPDAEAEREPQADEPSEGRQATEDPAAE